MEDGTTQMNKRWERRGNHSQRVLLGLQGVIVGQFCLDGQRGSCCIGGFVGPGPSSAPDFPWSSPDSDSRLPTLVYRPELHLTPPTLHSTGLTNSTPLTHSPLGVPTGPFYRVRGVRPPFSARGGKILGVMELFFFGAYFL